MAYDTFTVVLPTLNEEATIGKLVSYLISKYTGISVLVVDDGSTDATEEIVNRISSTNKKVKLINRKRLGLQKGLTASIVDGIKASRTKYAIVMDADLQHPPSVVGKIAQCLLNGSNLVIAVRKTEKRWPFYRKLISKSLMGFGKLILFSRGKQSSADIFSGFFGVERKLFVSVYSNNKN
ncbi:MAG: glycosyltransferase family 2 protein, partial [Candidatus Micrarchaeia archaeon]